MDIHIPKLQGFLRIEASITAKDIAPHPNHDVRLIPGGANEPQAESSALTSSFAMPRTHEGPTPMTARNPEARCSRSTLNSAPETKSASRTHNLPGGGSTRPGNEGPARRPRSGRPVRLTTESPSGPPRGLRPPRERPPCLWTAVGGHAHPSSRAPRGTPARALRTAVLHAQPAPPLGPRSRHRPAPCAQWVRACGTEGASSETSRIAPRPQPHGPETNAS